MRRYLISLSSTTDRSLRWQKWLHAATAKAATDLAKLTLGVARDHVPEYATLDTWTVTEPGGPGMLPRIIASGRIGAD